MVIPDPLERETYIEMLNLVGHPACNVNALIGKGKKPASIFTLSAPSQLLIITFELTNHAMFRGSRSRA